MALNLDGSSLDSLRDLGSELTVKYLNVSRCGLKSLDGINGIQTLEQLVADNNKIECVFPLTHLVGLKSLSLNGFVNDSTGAAAIPHLNLPIKFRLQESHQNDRSTALPRTVHAIDWVEFVRESGGKIGRLSAQYRWNSSQSSDTRRHRHGQKSSGMRGQGQLVWVQFEFEQSNVCEYRQHKYLHSE